MSGVAASPPSVDFRFLLGQVWGEPRDLKLTAEEMAARRDARVRAMAERDVTKALVENQRAQVALSRAELDRQFGRLG